VAASGRHGGAGARLRTALIISSASVATSPGAYCEKGIFTADDTQASSQKAHPAPNSAPDRMGA
jgi:hypothetical protein